MRKSRLDDISYYPSLRVSVSSLLPYSYVGVEHLVKDRGGVCLSPDMPNADSAIQFRPGDILLGNIRPYLKKIWLADITGGASGDVIVVRIRDEYKDSITPDYLYKVLSSDQFFAYDNLNTKGAKMPRGDKKSIAAYLIPIPSIGEQKSIVDELDLLTSIIDKKNAQLRDLDAMAQSIFYEMFGDPISNEKKWALSTIDQVCKSIIRGPFGSALKKEFFVQPGESTYKVYEQKHAIQKSASIGSYYIDNERFLSLSRFSVEPGDIIMSCSGTIGELFTIPANSERGIINQALLLFRLNSSIEHTYFLFVMEALKSSLDTKGAGIQNIGSVKFIKSMAFAFPDLSLQRAFSEKIRRLEKMKLEIESSLKETTDLYNCRMDMYFN